ncbi:unnamed protein product [Prorocentrum cordatum]|uniref:ADP,ATP carrier protein n=1 Tax=Prorocentrum cordatum TaxID=2364126 RepID=A0ABN9WCF4_9DINO|nr:unnamed protein product [Polarella glacialis]
MAEPPEPPPLPAPAAPARRAAGPPGATGLSRGELLAAGAGAGVVSKTATAPLDRIRILFQVDRRRAFTLTGFVLKGARIVRTEGVLGLWRGNLAVVLRAMPYAGLQFASFNQYYALLLPLPVFNSQEKAARFCAGAAAGATATVLTYPLDFLRAQMAVSASSLSMREVHSSYVVAAQEIVRDEGFSALYTGIRPTLLGIVPNAGMSFMVFETLKPWIQTEVLGLRSESDMPMSWRFLAGGCAGFLAQSASYPLNVVRRRMQVQGLMEIEGMAQPRYSSVGQALLTILRTEGLVRGLYKGGSLTLVKGPLSTATGFAANDYLKSLLARARGDPERIPPFLWADAPDVVSDPTGRLTCKVKELTPFEHLVSGGTAGAVAKTVVAPAERVKILYQTNSQRAFRWTGVLRTGLKIYQNTGMIGLWRGHTATLIQQVPKSATTYATFDFYRRWIYGLEAVDKVTARFAAGALAGATSTTLTYPLDLMRARMAAHWDMSPRYPNYAGELLCFRGGHQGGGAPGAVQGPAANPARHRPVRGSQLRHLRDAEGQVGFAHGGQELQLAGDQCTPRLWGVRWPGGADGHVPRGHREAADAGAP